MTTLPDIALMGHGEAVGRVRELAKLLIKGIEAARNHDQQELRSWANQAEHLVLATSSRQNPGYMPPADALLRIMNTLGLCPDARLAIETVRDLATAGMLYGLAWRNGSRDGMVRPSGSHLRALGEIILTIELMQHDAPGEPAFCMVAVRQIASLALATKIEDQEKVTGDGNHT